MAAPLIPALLRLLFQVGAKSPQSLVTKIYNKSGKTMSQKRLWELTRSLSGVRELEKIYSAVMSAPTLTSLKKSISVAKQKVKNKKLNNELSEDLNSYEVRVYLANKVLSRIRREGKKGLKAKSFLVKLGTNILSGTYSVKDFTLDEIVDYIDDSDLSSMIETFKVEGLYYG